MADQFNFHIVVPGEAEGPTLWFHSSCKDYGFSEWDWEASLEISFTSARRYAWLNHPNKTDYDDLNKSPSRVCIETVGSSEQSEFIIAFILLGRELEKHAGSLLEDERVAAAIKGASP